MAPTARVAQRIGGQTIHSALKLGWTPGSVLYTLEKQLQHETDEAVCLEKSAVLVDTFDCPQMPDIVVVDEIGMVSFWLAHCIIQYFFRRPKPILFVAMGDPNQLRPVKTNHNVFSVSLDIPIIRIDLKESKRFSPEYESIIQQLRYYVDTNDETGLFTYICGTFPIVEHIDTRFTKMYPSIGLPEIDRGSVQQFLFETFDSRTTDPFMDQNERRYGYNLCGCKRFAGTIHKFQGDTMDDDAIAMNFNGSRDLNLVYTALSRVKSINQIVALQL
ncbi:uncharacterized protein TNCT_66831 [Trichonephila clavata]|uniref:Uncharacterized protein n=1 Tax=Trichonephila clavata TaxID=2740835 RepID=A0A8X6FV36_TRICU|nr:uncharacterized protein TNCT_66831 [Trichonephila clavata]